MTFTERAAAEMRARIDSGLGSYLGELWIGTFHSIAQTLLREDGWRIGVPPSFRVLAGADRWIQMRELLWELGDPALIGVERPDDLVNPLLRLLERLKQELIAPARLEDWARTCEDRELGEQLLAAVDGEVAKLSMKVQPFGGANSELELKSNSYDLSVDIELADAIQRLRFEHPGVKCCVITSAHDKIFCAGANIYMLAASTHPFKVNFCKYTNETRLTIEEASAESGIRFLAACNGATAGGGYELALACDEIVLVDDGSSTVSLPEVPLLGVLPGTGGLTRVVDKRKVRRDLADAFSTLAEGVKGKRAVEWGLVDAVVPRSELRDTTAQLLRHMAGRQPAEAAD